MLAEPCYIQIQISASLLKLLLLEGVYGSAHCIICVFCLGHWECPKASLIFFTSVATVTLVLWQLIGGWGLLGEFEVWARARRMSLEVKHLADEHC